ncbi:MAG: peptidoglycan-binding domain-containing protein [Pseudomonadota bacterium]
MLRRRPCYPVFVCQRLCRALALLILCAIPAPASAERRALVIGIDAYDEIPDLEKAGNDARATAAAHGDLGFVVTAALRAGHDFTLGKMLDEPRIYRLATRRQIQRILTEAGIYNGPIDGAFGPGTKAAIRAYAALQ